MVELTKEEEKNGWTRETLEVYIAEREKAQTANILSVKSPKPKYANNRYRPLDVYKRR